MVEMLITSLSGLEEHENRAANMEALVHVQKSEEEEEDEKNSSYNDTHSQKHHGS